MGERSLAEWLGEANTGDSADTLEGPDAGPPAERPARRRGWRGRALWLSAIGVWAVLGLGLLAVRGVGPAESPAEPARAYPAEVPGAPGGPDGAARSDGDDETAEGTAAGAPEAAAGRGMIASGESGAAGEAPAPSTAADALALAAVHLALTGGHEDGSERYVERAAVDGRIRADDTTVVITVLAVVLEGADGAWTGRRPARFAVPVRDAADAPVLSGDPWPLPAPDVDVRARPDGTPDDEPTTAEAVHDALAGAGYEDVRVDAVERLEGGLLRAAVSAVVPGEAGQRHVEVWLAGDPEPVLLGLQADTTRREERR